MKTLTKAVVAASIATASTVSLAETSLSLGYMSDYYFRGVQLGESSAWASVDYENSGFFAGVWAADDGNAGQGNDGLETDFYLGYGGEVDGFSYSIGYTRYEYTYDAGDNSAAEGLLGLADIQTSGQFEHEINLGAGIAGFGLDIAIGVAEADHVITDPAIGGGAATNVDTEQDYTYIALSYENGPWGVLVAQRDADDVDVSGGIGTVANTDSEYMHAEVSYSTEIGGFDATAVLGQVFGQETGGVDTASAGNNYLTFGISKGFDL